MLMIAIKLIAPRIDNAQTFVSQMGFCNSGIVIHALVGTLKTSDTHFFTFIYLFICMCMCF